VMASAKDLWPGRTVDRVDEEAAEPGQVARHQGWISATGR